ncbi:hypothetical protein BGW42_006556 [Actinomortierella wolfii]|nr:hypothetical protein BGW42_006556 [Actinomortierella wolfii]
MEQHFGRHHDCHYEHRDHHNDHCKSHTTIAISACDSWLGYCLAEYLAEKLLKKCKNVRLLCLAVDIEHIEHLKKHKNVTVKKVNNDDEDSLCQAFSKVEGAIIIPEAHEKRVEQAEKLIACMNKQNVKYAMLFSSVGADSEGLPELNKFLEIEKTLKDKMSRYLILRVAWLDQIFFLWRSAIQNYGSFPISIDKNSKFAPVDMRDVLYAIENIVVHFCESEGGHCCHLHDNRHHGHGHDHHHSHNHEDHHHHSNDHDHDHDHEDVSDFGKYVNKTLTLIGPCSLTIQQIIESLSEAMRKEIELKSVTREEMKEYLDSLMNRQGASSTTDRSASGHGGGDFGLNDTMIALLLDKLDSIKRGDADFTSGHLAKLIGGHGHTVCHFFEREKDYFRCQC